MCWHRSGSHANPRKWIATSSCCTRISTETRYATIEKEALAATWACEKFSDYVTGLDFLLETDHKPLVPLLSSKELAKMPARIQRFKMRMMRFNPRIQHVSGKQQIIADALSRAPTGHPSEVDLILITEVETYTDTILTALPATEQRLQQLITAQKADEMCTRIREYCTTGWPAYMPHLPLLRPYWEIEVTLQLLTISCCMMIAS